MCKTLHSEKEIQHIVMPQESSHSTQGMNSLTCKARQVLGSIVVSISACHAEDPGSIPGRGVLFLNFLSASYF